MASHNKKTPPVKTALTVFRIVESVKRNGRSDLTQLSNELDLAKSTIHNHLSTLESLRYVVKEDNEYRLGLKFLDHGIYARDRYPLLEAAEGVLERLSQETGKSVWLHVEEHGLGIPIYKNLSDQTVRTAARLGKASHLHCTAHGKAMLAHFSEEYIEEVLDQHGMPAYTENTCTEREPLDRKLTEIRENEFALSDCEAAAGVRAVGSPIVEGDRVLGAICIPGPENRMTGDYFTEELPELVSGATNELELELADFKDMSV
jgi:DNA-binding IclR family transcriptional regulator